MTRAQAGMTLLELLVALSAFLLLSILLFHGLSFSSRAWARVTEETTHSGDLATAQAFLRSRLEQAASFAVIPGSALDRYPMSGDSSVMRFHAPAPEALTAGELLQYELTTTADPPALVLRWRPSDASARAAGTDWTTEVLLEGAATLDVSYLTPERSWVQSWSTRTDVPALIRIALRGAPDRQAWPTLSVAPLLTAPRDCVFDSVLMDCRT
jgi:prepilin-type N-terminal cleavage/methylation domain-containing protein